MSFPSVTEILSDEGVGFDMSHLPQEYSDRGTHIHLLAYQKVMGMQFAPTPEKWQGFRDALFKYFAENPITRTIWAEDEIVHRLLGVKMHPDFFGEMAYRLTLRDYKTGSIPLYCRAQLAGYELGIKHILPEYGDRVFDHVAVKLMDNGKYSLKSYTEAEKAEGLREFMNAYHGYMERRGVKWSHR
jgi:hypothetical protein